MPTSCVWCSCALSGVGGDQGALASTSLGGLVPTVWVYVPSVTHALDLELDAVATSLEAQRLVGVALGRVLAHEVVHLLAPDVEHADTGVMRSRLHAFYLTRGRPALEADCASALAAGARAWLAAGGSPGPPPGAGSRRAPRREPGGSTFMDSIDRAHGRGMPLDTPSLRGARSAFVMNIASAARRAVVSSVAVRLSLRLSLLVLLLLGILPGGLVI